MRKLLLVVACLTQFDLDLAVKRGACDALCKKEGYTNGLFSGENCLCLDTYNYIEFTSKKIKIPSRLTTRSNFD